MENATPTIPAAGETEEVASIQDGSDGTVDQQLVNGHEVKAEGEQIDKVTEKMHNDCDEGLGTVSNGPSGEMSQEGSSHIIELQISAGDSSAAVSDMQTEENVLNLTDLPSEILLHITSFIDSRTIIKSVSKTCQMFSDYFEDEAYWRSRTCHRWPKPFPIFQREDLSWQETFMEREEAVRVWSRPEDNFHHLIDREGYFAAVDIVHLLQEGRFLVTGSRDRRINLLDLSKVTEDNPKPKDLHVFKDEKTHKGWVWSMASHDTTLVTGCWDTSIRLWQLREGTLECEQNRRFKSAVLSLHYEPGFVAAGCFDKRLYMFDPREPEETMTKKLYHKQPVLSLAADDKYVITGSEDKVITIYDRVAGKKFKQIETDSFVMDMSYGNGQLWTGDKEGKLHVLNTADGLFDETTIQTIDVGHSGQLSSVIHTDGAVFTSSTNSGIKVIHPTLDPDVMCKLNVHSAPIARLSYKNGILASAGSDACVGLWIPKNLQL